MDRSILLVDDDPNVTKSLQRLFKSEDVKLYIASNGASALEVVEAEHIDLVITDQMMPEMNGSDFLAAALKVRPQLIPIMLSAYSTFDTLVHAVNQGRIVHFLSKPWDSNILKTLVFRELAALEVKDRQDEESQLLNALPDLWCLVTAEGKILKCNESFRAQVNQCLEKVIGSAFDSNLIINEGEVKITDLIERSLKGRSWEGDLKINQKGGKSWKSYPFRACISLFKERCPEKAYLVTLKEDLEGEILKKELNKLVLLDLESGALNRSSFLKSTEAMISSLQREEKIIMAVIRVPKLEQLSLTLTAPVFQSVCYKLINRIKSLSAGSNLIGRISGDKFAVLSESYSLGTYHGSFMSELKSLFSQSFKVTDRDIPIIPEVGFCTYPDEADTASKMVLHALTGSSLLVSRDKYKSTPHYILECDFIVNRDIGEAIENNEFSFVYQPIIDINTRALKGLECLLRWYEKGELVVDTETLISHINRIGLSVNLDRLVMRSAIMQLAFWKNDGIDTSIFINVSPSSLSSSQFCAELIAEIRQCNIDPSRVTLEIIESSIIEVNDYFLSNIKQLRDQGVRIFLDDFGTGFSSLETLKDIGIDGIKVDKGFIDGIDSEQTKFKITKCLLDLSQSLSCELIAEGIEQKSQLDCLKSLGGGMFGQGYYISMPFCASGIVSYLKRCK